MALAQAERNVGEIEQATGIGQPGLSQQLGVLRKAGLVQTRQEAKLVFYALSSVDLASVATAMAGLAATEPLAEMTPELMATPTPGVANFARLT